MPVLSLPVPETDYFLAVPLSPSAGQQVLRVVMETTGSIVDGDTTNVYLGAAVTNSATESLANMDGGQSVVEFNPDDGASSSFYPGTTAVYAMWPYVMLGKQLVYYLPLPPIVGQGKYLILACQFVQFAGASTATARVTATVEPYPVRAFQAEFTEHSGPLNDYRSFGSQTSGRAWLPGAKLVISVGSDGGSSVVHSLFPVAAGSADMDLSALQGGTPLVSANVATVTFSGVPGMQFLAPFGEVVRLEFPLPTLPPTQSGFPLFRYVNNSPSDIHVSFVVHVEDGGTGVTRRAGPRGGDRRQSLGGK